MNRPWIRLYTDLPANPKAQRLPPPLFKFWINCLCLYGKRGSMPTNADLAWILKMSDKLIYDYCEKLIDYGLFESLEGGVIPHDWDDLQFESDTSRERQKKYRERNTKKPRDVTGDVTVTAQEQNREDTDTEQIQNQTQKKNVGESVAVIAHPAAAEPDFQNFIGVFLALGVALSETDLRRCCHLWISLEPPERKLVMDHALGESRGEWVRREERYVPRPWNYLTDKPWTRLRVANGREKAASKSEISTDRAIEMYRRESKLPR